MAYLFQVLIVICNFHCTKSAIASMIASNWVEHHRPSEFRKEKGQKFQEAPRMLQSSKHFLDALRTLRKPGISSAWNCILDYISTWPLYSTFYLRRCLEKTMFFFFTWVYLSHKFSLDAVAAAPSLLLWLLRKCSFCATRMTHCACLPSTTIRLLLPCIRSLDKFRRDFAPP